VYQSVHVNSLVLGESFLIIFISILSILKSLVRQTLYDFDWEEYSQNGATASSIDGRSVK